MAQTVILEIQGSKIECNRSDLIAHSDYFKAMFEGNFVESCKNIIQLNGIDVMAMNLILKLLWDREYLIEEENILSVLQASCMLQFLEVKDKCIERIEELLTVKNCLKFWLHTEHLGLEVHLKAKLMSLLEFMYVKDCDYFLELNFDEILQYLNNVYLRCDGEMDIFKAIINWFKNVEEKSEEMLLKLLHCLDFTEIKEREIVEIISCKPVTGYTQTVDILKCICNIKSNYDISMFDKCLEIAESLLKSKRRNLQGFPCILVENLKTERENSSQDVTVLYYDQFKRKRKYNVLETKSTTGLSIICVDYKNSKFIKLLEIESQKCANLDGFKIVGYKHFIYLFGGEFLLGKGDWNRNVHVYDVIKEKWKQIKSLPYPRRHFETCVCRNKMFVIGGTGSFRVIQENMFFYNFETGTWSKEYKLPCSGRQIKCCEFNNKLFVLNINNKCAYVFDCVEEKWQQFEICDKDNVLPSYSKKLSLFSYQNSVYVKENKLFELQLHNNVFVIVKETLLDVDQRNVCQIESILCYDKLYSLNKQICEEIGGQTVTLDIFDVGNRESMSFDTKSGGEVFKFKSSLVLFSVFHHSLIVGSDQINNFAVINN